MENKKLDNYSYINKNVLELMYEFCCKQNLRVDGIRCRVFWDKDKECISYISDFITHYKIDEQKLHLETLFHNVWCNAEWCARCLTRDTFASGIVKNTFGETICKEILLAI